MPTKYSFNKEVHGKEVVDQYTEGFNEGYKAGFQSGLEAAKHSIERLIKDFNLVEKS